MLDREKPACRRGTLLLPAVQDCLRVPRTRHQRVRGKTHGGLPRAAGAPAPRLHAGKGGPVPDAHLPVPPRFPLRVAGRPRRPHRGAAAHHRAEVVQAGDPSSHVHPPRHLRGTIPWVAIHGIDWIHWFSAGRITDVSASHTSAGNRGHGEMESSGVCLYRLANGVRNPGLRLFPARVRPHAWRGQGADRGRKGSSRSAGGEAILLHPRCGAAAPGERGATFTVPGVHPPSKNGPPCGSRRR